MKTLIELFQSQLKDMYDAEKRIAKALPKMTKAATCKKLQAAFENHLLETEGHIENLEGVFECFGWSPKAVTCKATVGLLEEAETLISDFDGSIALNAALISAAQKVEHYEIASYGTLHAWALLLENESAAELISEILEEEKATNDILTDLALEKNQEAMGELYATGVGSDTDDE